MSEISLCGKCGVPALVSAELGWESNGVIISKTSPQNRWVFYESENIDPLFHGIEELIGAPIENIIIESRRRESRRYMERLFPLEVKEAFRGHDDPQITAEDKKAKLTAARNTINSIYDVGRIFGYADISLHPAWESGEAYPWRFGVVHNPYSVLFQLAESLGTCEAFEGMDMWVKYEKADEGTYIMEFFPSDHPVGLAERFKGKRYDFKPGDIAYDYCPQCGVPEEISRYAWDLESGSITDPDTGRRMAIFGPHSLDSIFTDLEEELGEDIPRTIIEAQRRYIKSAWSTEKWLRGAEDFKRLSALRGLGNLASFDADREQLTVRVQNSALPIFMVGTVQALVEMAYGVDNSTCSWESFNDGDLLVTIKVR
jgi:hypothetical protein